jgi:hypothetical protein
MIPASGAECQLYDRKLDTAPTKPRRGYRQRSGGIRMVFARPLRSGLG